MEDRDKRDFYRISDTILIEYQHVSASETETASASDFFTSDPNFHLLRDIYELQLESQEQLRSISNQNRALGSFLANLDRRVEILAKSVVQQHMEGELVERQVEISEGGLSFLSESVIEPEQHLVMRLLFQPSCLGLVCFAEVKHCQLEGEQYRIGVRFLRADQQTQRLISRHIISKQAEERRARLHKHN